MRLEKDRLLRAVIAISYSSKKEDLEDAIYDIVAFNKPRPSKLKDLIECELGLHTKQGGKS